MDGTTVEPGQIWADNDKRSIGRKVRVDGIDDEYARCTVVADRDDACLTRARHSAQLRRFKRTSAGYRLMED